MKKIIGLVVIVAVILLGVLFYFSPTQKLQRLGYSAAEAKSFVQTLDDTALHELMEREYSSIYAELLTVSDFQLSNFGQYLVAIDQNQMDVVSIVQLVNHPDYDENLTYSSRMLEILLHPRYISANRERYFSYDERQASVDDVISMVNANRDHDYYTHTSPTDLAQGQLILVNKYYYLDESYIPDLVILSAEYGTPGVEIASVASESFFAMFAAALEAGFRLYVTSGYRGFEAQSEVYNTWVAAVGEAEAPNYAALPGYSEHQTGLALDIFVMGETTSTFSNHPAAQWLAENAWHYGFILRYAEESEELTGYEYEAWHFRYVGEEAAAEIYQNDLTLEEYWALKFLQ